MPTVAASPDSLKPAKATRLDRGDSCHVAGLEWQACLVESAAHLQGMHTFVTRTPGVERRSGFEAGDEAVAVPVSPGA